MKELITTNNALASIPLQEENWKKLQLMFKYCKIELVLSILLVLNGIAFIAAMVYWPDFNTAQLSCAFAIPLVIWLLLAIPSNIFENKYTKNVKNLGITFAERKALYKVNHRITMCAFLLGLFAWFITIRLYIWTKSIYDDAKKHIDQHLPFFIDISNDKDDDGSIGGFSIWNWI